MAVNHTVRLRRSRSGVPDVPLPEERSDRADDREGDEQVRSGHRPGPRVDDEQGEPCRRGDKDARYVASEFDLRFRREVAVVAGDQIDATRDIFRSYAEWIEYNARVTAVNDLLATVTVVSVIVAFVCVIAGVAVGGAGLTTAAMWLTFLVVTAVMFGFSYVVVHMDHVDAAPDRSPGAFEGVRISKGGSRRRGTASLRRMIDPRPSDEDRADEDRADEDRADEDGSD